MHAGEQRNGRRLIAMRNAKGPGDQQVCKGEVWPLRKRRGI